MRDVKSHLEEEEEEEEERASSHERRAGVPVGEMQSWIVLGRERDPGKLCSRWAKFFGLYFNGMEVTFGPWEYKKKALQRKIHTAIVYCAFSDTCILLRLQGDRPYLARGQESHSV